MVFSWLMLLPLGVGGGFLVNYLADTLPRYGRVVSPQCLHCAAPHAGWKLYLLQRPCPGCGKSHPHRIRTWIIYFAVVSSTLWLWGSPPPRLGFWVGFLVSLLFYVILVIDVEHRLILHSVSLVGAVLSFLVGWRVHGLQSTLIGGLVGFGVMYLLYKFGEVFTRFVSRLRSEALEEVALGFGDVNLGGLLGLLLGWPVILLGLVLAILAGGGFSLFFMVVSLVFGRYRSFEAMPYAPFMLLAAGLILFLPDLARAILGGLSPLMGAAMGAP